MSSIAVVTTFKITSAKLYVSIVTLSIKDNVYLTIKLNEGFKRSVYWNEYKSKIETKPANNQSCPRFLLDNANNGPNKVERNSHKKYFLPRVDITDYNVLICGRNFYDQPINNLIKQYDEIRKIATGKGDDYTTGCLLDYQSFKNNYKLIAVDLSKQK